MKFNSNQVIGDFFNIRWHKMWFQNNHRVLLEQNLTFLNMTSNMRDLPRTIVVALIRSSEVFQVVTLKKFIVPINL